MFHAERLKYKPLKGYRLLSAGLDKQLVAHLSELCDSFQITLAHANGPKAAHDEIKAAHFDFLLLSSQVAEEMDLHNAGSQATFTPLLIHTSDESKPDFQLNELSLEASESHSNAALRILDKLLSINETPPVPIDELETVNFDYLKETFAGQDERYRQLLEMMQEEFQEVREQIEQSLEQADLHRFREYKHKIQPSANYLRLMDLIQLMESVKQNFDQLDHVNNKHLVPKMMRYFDNVLGALNRELKRQSY